ncbi:MAG: S41 family peptidase [Blastocatellia bacterium]|nr:S41 family peptidase [Blastocatellia bacterium]MCS7157304.1 S41 family peptidase [Blastocatellia bacterium]MCX7752020.1 S41 family peptidase [Blastocatellia bacterium]MDW8167125.1 S41 family peptidase [Acidobacteriota bacterium]MDW8257229.1 S41 family peptidase [Acidobacteriota bacterium]
MRRSVTWGGIVGLLFTLVWLPGDSLSLSRGATHSPAEAGVRKAAVAGSLEEEKRETRELYQRTFEIVWGRVKEKYYDPTFGGVDWDAVGQRYRTRLEGIRAESELYALLQQMLGELRRSHFHIYPPGTFVEEGDPSEKQGSVGLDVRVLGRQVVITRVRAGSSAERAGLRPGFVLRRVEDREVDQLVRRLSAGWEPISRRRMRVARAVLAALEGEPGTWVRVRYWDAQNRIRETRLQRERIAGEWSERFGNFPPAPIEFEAKRLGGSVGYIRFNIFVVGLMERIRAAIRELSSTPALIFDLRGNPGGMGGMAAGVAGMLCAQQTSLGTMKLRSGHLNLAVFPQPNPYTGIVVILIDAHTGSTAEIFAAGLQELGRAIVVGERSAGAALPSLFERLPTGALFQYAIADFQTPKGVLIEGRGVIPDVEVRLTRRALLEGRDPQLEMALGEIARRLAMQKIEKGG